jgi:predicted amidohydrolase
MRDLIITTIQSDIYWEDIDANLSMFEQKLFSIKKTDIIILPEMFTTGFTMSSVKLAEKKNERTTNWMINQAKLKDSCIVGSFIYKEKNKNYNTLLWAFPDGSYKTYHKRHLFRMANEDEFYSAGTDRLIIEYKKWKICPLICYDLRFPVWSRNTEKIDLYIYIANWPQARVNAWNKLLEARAIENLAYVIGVNRVGKDAKDIEYSGNSTITDFKGDNIKTHKSFQESTLSTTLSKQNLIDFRNKFPAHLDADDFEIV